MTARKLEEFISLIETAEKISHTESTPSTAYLPRSTPHNSARPSNRDVPSLKIPASPSTSSTPHRYVGPPASHCGLTVSDVPSTGSTTERVTARSVVNQRRGSVVSLTPERKDSVNSVASHAETIMNLQKNAPFVRRISQEMLPASSDER